MESIQWVTSVHRNALRTWMSRGTRAQTQSERWHRPTASQTLAAEAHWNHKCWPWQLICGSRQPTLASLFSVQFSSVQFSHSVMPDSLRPHESQHARPSCPSPTPGVYSNPCPSSQRCHPTISFSVVPFSFCLFILSRIQNQPGSLFRILVALQVISHIRDHH